MRVLLRAVETNGPVFWGESGRGDKSGQGPGGSLDT